jgi:hypothetical protein
MFKTPGCSRSEHNSYLVKREAYLVGRGLLVVMLIVLLTNRKDYELFLSDVVFVFDGSRSESGVFATLRGAALRIYLVFKERGVSSSLVTRWLRPAKHFRRSSLVTRGSLVERGR